MADKSVVPHSDSANVFTYMKESVIFEDRSPWLSQKQIAFIFGLAVNTVNDHIRKYKELRSKMAKTTIRSHRIVTPDGKTRKVEHYNIDVITFVGYCAQATEQTLLFQEWNAEILKRHFDKLVKQEYLRDRTKLSYKALSAAEQYSHYQHHPQYATLAKTIDRAVFELTYNAMLDTLGIDKSQPVRDYLSDYALSAIEDIELASAREMESAGEAILHTKDQQQIIRKWADHYTPVHKRAAELAGADFISGRSLIGG